MKCPTCLRPWHQKSEPSPGAACPHCRAGTLPAFMHVDEGWAHQLENGQLVPCVDEGAR